MKKDTDLLATSEFTCIGEWGFGDYKSTKHLAHMPGITFTIRSHSDARDFVYAFTVDDEVVYIGESSQPMGWRFQGYRYGNPLERDTDNRVKIHLTEALSEGRQVLIWYYSGSVDFKFAGETLHIPVHKPIEEVLIRKFRPVLNNTK
ncbi:MAG: hypothetical protein PF795_14220 [Kiritimatiellae bacterium]|jgi:hypothetical protein|nr:hypothetical protein [Kiritimatiellia bacterium]